MRGWSVCLYSQNNRQSKTGTHESDRYHRNVKEHNKKDKSHKITWKFPLLWGKCDKDVDRSIIINCWTLLTKICLHIIGTNWTNWSRNFRIFPSLLDDEMTANNNIYWRLCEHLRIRQRALEITERRTHQVWKFKSRSIIYSITDLLSLVLQTAKALRMHHIERWKSMAPEWGWKWNCNVETTCSSFFKQCELIHLLCLCNTWL